MKRLNQDACSKIIVNGQRTESFSLHRSVRQVCPLAPFLFVLLSDIFLQMIQQAQEVEGLELPSGKILKILSFTDDHMVLCKTTQSLLDAYAGVISEYELVSGLLISWEKLFASCSGAHPPSLLPGLLHLVHILQPGETRKYLGAGYKGYQYWRSVD